MRDVPVWAGKIEHEDRYLGAWVLRFALLLSTGHRRDKLVVSSSGRQS
jgi:hypothetical protein